MEAVYEDVMEAPVPLRERLAGLRRRALPALVTFAVSLVLATGATLLWPANYRSSGTVLIEQQEIPLDLVRSTITSYADQRVQLITQRVMTTENLLRIIDKFELYPELRKDAPREELIAEMRENVHMDMISANVVDPRVGRPVTANIAFSVGFDSHSAQTAVRVANELTTLYLNENLTTRRQQAEETANFLGAEGDRLNVEVAALEKRLAEFKRQHADSLPERVPMNLSLVTRAEDELRDIAGRIQSLDEQAIYLATELARIEPMGPILSEEGQPVLSSEGRLRMLRSQYLAAQARYKPGHPTVGQLKREIEALEKEVGAGDEWGDLVRQLEQARNQLSAAKQRYREGHPDVQQLEELVASIERGMQADPGIAAEMQRYEEADNPAYLQINTRMQAIDTERRSLNARAAELRERIRSLEGSLAGSPAVEQDYATIFRDLDGTRLKYQQVRQKQLEAQLSQNLETQRMGEKFTLIEPPLPPEEPVTPNRPLLLTMGFIFSIVLALGVALALETLDRSVRGRLDLERIVAAPPLVTVPWIETAAERAAVRRRVRLGLATSAGALVVAVVALHLLWRPLDVLWFVALRRFGL